MVTNALAYKYEPYSNKGTILKKDMRITRKLVEVEKLKVKSEVDEEEISSLTVSNLVLVAWTKEFIVEVNSLTVLVVVETILVKLV